MKRQVFFSFHYHRDRVRARQVRQVLADWDGTAWETMRRVDAAIRWWINRQIRATSVTTVLIGQETASRDLVLYEIERSHAAGHGLLGIHIHAIPDENGATDLRGANPFESLHVEQGARRVSYASLYRTYDWFCDDGARQFGNWVEFAAREVELRAGRGEAGTMADA